MPEMKYTMTYRCNKCGKMNSRRVTDRSAKQYPPTPDHAFYAQITRHVRFRLGEAVQPEPYLPLEVQWGTCSHCKTVQPWLADAKSPAGTFGVILSLLAAIAATALLYQGDNGLIYFAIFVVTLFAEIFLIVMLRRRIFMWQVKQGKKHLPTFLMEAMPHDCSRHGHSLEPSGSNCRMICVHCSEVSYLHRYGEIGPDCRRTCVQCGKKSEPTLRDHHYIADETASHTSWAEQHYVCSRCGFKLTTNSDIPIHHGGHYVDANGKLCP